MKKPKRSKKPKKQIKRGQRLDKGESLYTPQLAARIKQVIIEAELVKTDGSLHYSKIARVIGVPSRTLSRWRNPASEYYKPQLVKALAEAAEELLEIIDSNKIKRSMIKRAQPYTRVKKTKELQVCGPKRPPLSSMDKKALQEFAARLGLKIDGSPTKGQMIIKIEDEIAKQTRTEMVTVKEEHEKVPGDVAAARLVLPNIGPKNKRWQDKQTVDLEGRSLVDIIAKAGLTKK